MRAQLEAEQARLISEAQAEDARRAREEAEAVVSSKVDVVASIRTMAGFLRTTPWFRRFVAVQMVLGTAAATFAFFVVRARALVSAPGSGVDGDQLLGLFVIVQNLGGVAAALICGQLIDRVGSWLAIRVVTVAQVAALTAAIFRPPRSLLTTRVARASPSTSSAMMSSGFWL